MRGPAGMRLMVRAVTALMLVALLITWPSVAPAMAADSPVVGIQLTLTDSVSLALRQNPGVLIALRAVDIQKASVQAARGLLFPSISVDASYDRSMYEAGNDPVAMATLKANWPDLIPPIYHKDLRQQHLTPLEQSNLGEQTAEYDLTRAKLSAAFDVTQAFVSVVKAKQQKSLADLQLEIAQSALADTQDQVGNGTATQADLLKAQTQLGTAQFNQTKADHDVEAAKRVLVSLLGLTPDTPVEVVNDLKYLPEAASSANLETRNNEALRSRPEVGQAEVAVRRAQAAYADAARSSDPSLSVNGQYNADHYSLAVSSDLVSGDTGLTASLSNRATAADAGKSNDGWNVGVRFTMPLFDGGTARSQAEQLRLTLENQRFNLEKQKQAVLDDLYNAWVDLQESDLKVSLTQKTSEQAQQMLEIVQARFAAGVAVKSDALNAQLSLAQARTEATGAVLDYYVALARLDKASGRLPGVTAR